MGFGLRYIILLLVCFFYSISAFPQGMSDASLEAMLIREHVQHHKIVLAQAKLETGNYTSSLCKNKHNLFGLKGKRGYIAFNSYVECIRYYKNHIQNRYNSHSNYYTFLQRIGYARDPNYITKLKKIVKNL